MAALSLSPDMPTINTGNGVRSWHSSALNFSVHPPSCLMDITVTPRHSRWASPLWIRDTFVSASLTGITAGPTDICVTVRPTLVLGELRERLGGQTESAGLGRLMMHHWPPHTVGPLDLRGPTHSGRPGVGVSAVVTVAPSCADSTMAIVRLQCLHAATAARIAAVSSAWTALTGNDTLTAPQ